MFPEFLCLHAIYKATKRQYTHCSQDRKTAVLEQEDYNTRYHPSYQPVDQRESCRSVDKSQLLSTDLLIYTVNHNCIFIW